MMVMVVKDMEVARAVQLAVSVVERARAVHLADSVRVRVVESAVLVVARAAWRGKLVVEGEYFQSINKFKYISYWKAGF